MTSDTIPHSRHTIGGSEADYLSKVLTADDWAGGETIGELIEFFYSRFGFCAAQAASSGTAALVMAIRSLELGDRNRIIIPTYICREVLDAVFLAGAQPVLADVDPATGHLTCELVHRALCPDVGAIVVADLFGHLADVEGIAALGLPVIQDSAQSIGAHLSDGTVYNVADFVVFSFHGTKMVSSGEGGLVATKKPLLAERLLAVDYHEMFSPAVPLRISTLQAAVGLTQLKLLDQFVKCREWLVDVYDEQLAQLNLRIVRPRPMTRSAWYRYVVQVDQDIDVLVNAFEQYGVAVRKPVNRLLHHFAGAPDGHYPGAETAFARNLSLPLYPSLSSDEQKRVIDATLRILGNRSS